MEKWSLTALADGLLSHALSTSSRRGMRTVDGGHPRLLDQTVIALARGQRLEERDNPGDSSGGHGPAAHRSQPYDADRGKLGRQAVLCGTVIADGR
jgi:hypothetical protein